MNETSILLSLVAGGVLALVLIRFANRPQTDARQSYAIALFIAASIYVLFAIIRPASGPWLGIEILGVGLFGTAAWLGYRAVPLLLGLGWGAHVAWDVLLHLNGPGAHYTPDWYPWLCASFDVVIGGAVLRGVSNPADE